MKIRDGIILIIGSLVVGWAVLHSRPVVKDLEVVVLDTIQPPVPDTTLSVKNKKALFIGDSHSSNHNNGWQVILSKAVGFDMTNASIGGKTTFWMLEQALYRVNDDVDYCFVYGGANDMYSNMSPQTAIENIKGIARICRGHGVKCIVLTGFDPIKCTRTKNPNYANKYSIFQRLLLTENMDGAQVIDTRVVDRLDCWDDLCHMAPSGHKKIANQVIEICKFKRL